MGNFRKRRFVGVMGGAEFAPPLLTNLTKGEIYTAQLAITGNCQIYLPVEIQKMLEGSGKIRIQILGS